VRLALIYSARLRTAASWAIQMASEIEGDRNPRPALFCSGDPLDADDNPGATLVLRGDAGESATVTLWLSFMQPDAMNWQAFSPTMTIRSEPSLASVLSPCEPERGVIRRLRDQQVLRALIIGAAVVRSVQQGTEELAELVLTTDDYEQVRRLLQTGVVTAADEAHNPLAADMVGRANVYLTIKYGADQSPGNPFANDDDSIHPDGRSVRELVTRREVSDLGNVRSRMVRRLVEFLLRQPDGYEHFLRLGFVRRPPDREVWRRAGVDDLIGYLRTWSAKQVRTHFEQLRRVGMITAEREHGNGAWQYALPEELRSRSSVFRGLPSAADLAGGAPAL
jgi:hypothetical protein